jgi:hypothetical protein
LTTPDWPSGHRFIVCPTESNSCCLPAYLGNLVGIGRKDLVDLGVIRGVAGLLGPRSSTIFDGASPVSSMISNLLRWSR